MTERFVTSALHERAFADLDALADHLLELSHGVWPALVAATVSIGGAEAQPCLSVWLGEIQLGYALVDAGGRAVCLRLEQALERARARRKGGRTPQEKAA